MALILETSSAGYNWQVFYLFAAINQMVVKISIIEAKKLNSRDRQEVIDNRLRYNQHRHKHGKIWQMRKLTNFSLKYNDIFLIIEIRLVGWTYVIP